MSGFNSTSPKAALASLANIGSNAPPPGSPKPTAARRNSKLTAKDGITPVTATPAFLSAFRGAGTGGNVIKRHSKLVGKIEDFGEKQLLRLQGQIGRRGSWQLNRKRRDDDCSKKGDDDNGDNSAGLDFEGSKYAASILSDVVDGSGNAICFEDIVGLTEAKALLNEAVVWPLVLPQLFTGIREPWKVSPRPSLPSHNVGSLQEF